MTAATETPELAEVITLMPGEDGFAGWQKMESQTSSFWLPVNYWGLYMQEGNEAFYKTYQKGFLDPYSKILVLLELKDTPTPTTNPDPEAEDLSEIDFGIAVDDDQVISVVLIGEPVAEDSTLETQFQRIENELGRAYRVMERQIIEGSRYESGRMVFKFREDPIQPSGMQIMYFFLEGDRLWTLSFNTPIEQYEDILLMSEKSADSFEILQ